MRPALRVPLILQQKDKPYCGPASAQMVLAYHGVRMSQKRIVREMQVGRTGVDSMKMAVFFLRNGFEAVLVGWHATYPGSLFGRTGEDLREAIVEWSLRNVAWPSQFRRSCKRLIREFYALGGRIEARPVEPADLRTALRVGQPPILNLCVSTLWKLPDIRAGHYVVPVRMDRNAITMLDPVGEGGGRTSYPLIDVLHACYRLNSTALFVRPKP